MNLTLIKYYLKKFKLWICCYSVKGETDFLIDYDSDIGSIYSWGSSSIATIN